ncbi:Serine/threonine protein kinase [Fusarium falciforme]
MVMNHGNTVKLADFGLSTSDARSKKHGCGSTLYMSPECLYSPTTESYYMCAPSDIWSLGVILVNLTCGLNPWKLASAQDPNYREYGRSRGFLKSILPLSDDLSDILGCIFEPDPKLRVTLPELRTKVLACTTFTVPAVPALD